MILNFEQLETQNKLEIEEKERNIQDLIQLDIQREGELKQHKTKLRIGCFLVGWIQSIDKNWNKNFWKPQLGGGI